MQFLTDCAEDARTESFLLSTYEYAEEKRRGEVRIAQKDKLRVAETSGTFAASFLGDRVLTSEYNGVHVYGRDLAHIAHFDVGISYKHAVHGHTLISASTNGTFYEIDLETGQSTRHKLQCREGECAYDVWTAHIDASTVYLGCDMGTLSILDRREEFQSQSQYIFTGGVTHIGPAHEGKGGVEVGTYLGEYARFEEGSTHPAPSSKRSLSGIIWRIYHVSIAQQEICVVAQSYDGVGIYTRDMQKIRILPTNDLVYTVKIEGKDQECVLTGYNYYAGTLIHANLWDILLEEGVLKP
ncbi:hypothetical protein NECID01_0307 [Nematocida sp. AWRm77]|nr:hypothetical protein NECID01_0307 [Nematocida sp. AWRm77]